MSEDSIPASKRSHYGKSDLMRMVREDLVEKFLKQQNQLDYVSAKLQLPNDELIQLRELNSKMRSQLQESTQREGILVMRLTNKEQEVQELMTQIQEMKQSQNPGSMQLHSLFLDPSVNLMFQQMKKELENRRTKLELAQDDLAAWKFTPDSQIGKRLIVKCRMLLQENEEIGRMISSGSVAKLEENIALEKQLVLQMKNAEKETDTFLEELDEEMEGLQVTIYALQQQLKDSREQLKLALEEISRLRSTKSSAVRDTSPLVASSETKQVIKQEADDDGVSSTQVSVDGDVVPRRATETSSKVYAASSSALSHLKRRSTSQNASSASRTSVSRRKIEKTDKHHQNESSRTSSRTEKEHSSSDRHSKQSLSAADNGRSSGNSESRTRTQTNETDYSRTSKTSSALEMSNGLVSLHSSKMKSMDDLNDK